MHPFVWKSLRMAQAITVVVGTLAMLTAPLGCSRQPSPSGAGEEATDVGQLKLALTAVSSSGKVYRLRDGLFTISSLSTGEQVEVSTEDDPDASSIDVELAAGAYSVLLNPGYYIELIGGGADDGDDDDGPIGVPVPGPVPGPAPAVVDVKGRGFQATPVGADAGDDEETDEEYTDATDEEYTDETDEETDVGDADGGTGGPVLLSENPQLVAISGGAVTPVIFRFRVSGDDVVMGDGVLSIGIEVEDDAACEADDYEPNDDFLQATPMAVDQTLEATACTTDDDYYTFASPVAEGESFAVVVEFTHALGDVDAVLFDQYGYDVAYGSSVTDDEVLFAVSDGGQYTLLVYAFDGSNDYSVYLDANVGDLVSNCCETSPLPTCSVPEVDECVCDLDPYCCEIDFDGLCVMEAVECGADCGTNEGSCCETAEEGGCGDEEVEDCICAVDAQCCLSGYDQLCIDQAVASCSLQCEQPLPDSDCCEASEVGQCTDDEVNACVCAFDPYCCNVSYDENCVAMGITYCGASCEEGE